VRTRAVAARDEVAKFVVSDDDRTESTRGERVGRDRPREAGRDAHIKGAQLAGGTRNVAANKGGLRSPEAVRGVRVTC